MWRPGPTPPPPRPSGSPRGSPTGPPTGRRAAPPPRSPPSSPRRSAAGDLPARLPTDEDFGFGEDAGKLAQAYEGAWLACELIARDWGEEELIAFYKAVGSRSGRDGAVEQAMHTVLSTTPQDFTARWQEYLRDRLG